MNQLWKQTVDNPNLKLCPTENCQTIIKIKDDKFQCPKCNVKFCQECLLPDHKGPCSDNFQQHFKDWKRCPNCLMFIEREEGGNHMICTCSYHFCYICQGTWSDVHHHCEPKDQHEKGGCKKGLTNCLMGTLLRYMQKVHIYRYQILYSQLSNQTVVTMLTNFARSVHVYNIFPLRNSAHPSTANRHHLHHNHLLLLRYFHCLWGRHALVPLRPLALHLDHRTYCRFLRGSALLIGTNEWVDQ